MTLSEKNTHLHKKARLFTLIEILTAITIMAIGLGTIFYMVGGANSKLIKAEKMWGAQHMLNNSCEYFLLHGVNYSLPSDLLPYGYRATCELQIHEEPPSDAENADQAPLFAFENPYKGWVLGEYTITLFDPSGNEIGQQKIEKIIREED